MSNIIQIKHGTGSPKNLYPYELGIQTDNNNKLWAGSLENNEAQELKVGIAEGLILTEDSYGESIPPTEGAIKGQVYFKKV